MKILVYVLAALAFILCCATDWYLVLIGIACAAGALGIIYKLDPIKPESSTIKK